jgi:hypothetical protein
MGVSLTILCVCLMIAASAGGQQCKNVRVANVKSIFAIAPSPVGSDVLFYGSAEEAEGELVTGQRVQSAISGQQRCAIESSRCLKSPRTRVAAGWKLCILRDR